MQLFKRLTCSQAPRTHIQVASHRISSHRIALQHITVHSTHTGVCVYMYTRVGIINRGYRYGNRYMFIPVSVNKRSFYASLGLATQQQTLLSSPRFGVFHADVPKWSSPPQECFLFTDTGMCTRGNGPTLVGEVFRELLAGEVLRELPQGPQKPPPAPPSDTFQNLKYLSIQQMNLLYCIINLNKLLGWRWGWFVWSPFLLCSRSSWTCASSSLGAETPLQYQHACMYVCMYVGI